MHFEVESKEGKIVIIGNCKLCGRNGDLELSHFIPKFIRKWLKKTSITGYFRKGHEINKREQDLAKEYWLCGQCEDMFSVWEREFANRIFFPFVDHGVTSAAYGVWLSKLCASLSWRTLTYIKSINAETNDLQSIEGELNAAETHMENFLLGKVDNLNQYEQHLIPLEKIESNTYKDLPSNINRYFLRTVAMDVIAGEGNIYIYTKMPSFLLLGVVKSNHTSEMRASRVALRSGKISPKQYTFPSGVGGYICGSADEVSEAYSQIKPEDIERFEAYIEKNPEKAANLKLLEAILHDYEMFGFESTLDARK
jgi:hypothetical protein